MTPVECLARLAAMVPPPRYPLLWLHGVLAPRHAWRAQVVPRPPDSYAGSAKSSSKKKASSAASTGAEPGAAVVPRLELAGPSAQSGAGEASLVRPAEVVPTSTLVATWAASRVAPKLLGALRRSRDPPVAA